MVCGGLRWFAVIRRTGVSHLAADKTLTDTHFIYSVDQRVKKSTGREGQLKK